MRGRCTRGDDDQAMAGVERGPLTGEGDDRFTKRMDIRDPYEAGRSRGGQCSMVNGAPGVGAPALGFRLSAPKHYFPSRGGSISSRISDCTRASIISAPAAAEDASHAAAESPPSMALTRALAALSANRQDPISKSWMPRR